MNKITNELVKEKQEQVNKCFPNMKIDISLFENNEGIYIKILGGNLDFNNRYLNPACPWESYRGEKREFLKKLKSIFCTTYSMNKRPYVIVMTIGFRDQDYKYSKV